MGAGPVDPRSAHAAALQQLPEDNAPLAPSARGGSHRPGDHRALAGAGHQPWLLGRGLNALLILLALIVYEATRSREPAWRWSTSPRFTARRKPFTALLTQPGRDARADSNASQMATEFARALPQALEDIAAECHCLLLTRAVVAGPPEQVAAHVADLTASLKQKLGMP
jgi:hypothetical protein